MLKDESKEVWRELKDLWQHSSQTSKVHIQMSELLDELKGKVSQFEKDAINRDITYITASISQFEKNSVTKDITLISRLVKNLLRQLGIKK